MNQSNVISRSAWAAMSTEDRQRAVDHGARLGDPSCRFHGGDSGHSDAACPATDFLPPMRDAWCGCDADAVLERQRFFVNQFGHGWWDPGCKGLVQTG